MKKPYLLIQELFFHYFIHDDGCRGKLDVNPAGSNIRSLLMQFCRKCRENWSKLILNGAIQLQHITPRILRNANVGLNSPFPIEIADKKQLLIRCVTEITVNELFVVIVTLPICVYILQVIKFACKNGLICQHEVIQAFIKLPELTLLAG